MNLSPLERKILETVSKRQLISKNELSNALKIDTQGIETAAMTLASKKLITSVNPVGYTCYAITLHGTRLLHEMSE